MKLMVHVGGGFNTGKTTFPDEQHIPAVHFLFSENGKNSIH